MHLYLKKQVKEIIGLVSQFQSVLVEKADKHKETIAPGYTHLQRAQPISFGHHLMTYFWMLQRDKERYQEALKRIDVSPLGAGALAGTTFPIDRKRSAELLGFSAVYQNSIDAVSDRDFILEFLSASSILMMHMSRFAEEIILWSSQSFGSSRWTIRFQLVQVLCHKRKTRIWRSLSAARQDVSMATCSAC